MKKSFLVGLTILLVMGFILASCGSSPSYSPPSSSSSSYSRPAPEPPPRWANVVLTGENEPLLEGTTWISLQAAQYGYTETLEFRSGGQLVRRVRSSDRTQTFTDTWSREGNIIRAIFGNGATLFEARYYPQTKKIMGTLYFSDGRTSEDTLEPFQGSSIASSSSPSSTTNVYVQPSTPAQSPTPAPAPAPSTPTFQTGTYAWSNSGQNMTMQFSAGIVTMHLNNRQIWYGTYRINGTQLVISVNNTISDYSRLLGVTYSYTITSNTSFSGSGETWVRTGY